MDEVLASLCVSCSAANPTRRGVESWIFTLQFNLALFYNSLIKSLLQVAQSSAAYQRVRRGSIRFSCLQNARATKLLKHT